MKTEVGQRKGIKYHAELQRICDVMILPYKSKRWFLYIDNEYIGYFTTKSEMYDYLDNLNYE